MSAADNKRLLHHIFAELANGNAGPFVESMADDFSWTITGTTNWSKTFVGKKAVIGELLAGLQAALNPPIRLIPNRILADEDHVVVEAYGINTTKTGKPYNNRYCFVFRLADGQLQELTEYLDTELVTTAFGDLARAAGDGRS